MAHEDEWTDWHLTESGWIRGDCKTTHSEVKRNERQNGTILTQRYRELQTSSFSKTKISVEDVWDNGDKTSIEKLKKKFPFPNSL
jgi:hypothetical protein